MEQLDCLCACGCGLLTKSMPFSHLNRGWIRGKKFKFVHGHNSKKQGERWSVLESGCWEWKLNKNWKGYGSCTVGGINRMAHRVVFESFRGTIPIGFELDHICKNRGCVNPDHLRVVTKTENIRRSAVAKINMGIAGAIRKSHSKNKCTIKETAKAFGLGRHLVGNVITGRTWA